MARPTASPNQHAATTTRRIATIKRRILVASAVAFGAVAGLALGHSVGVTSSDAAAVEPAQAGSDRTAPEATATAGPTPFFSGPVARPPSQSGATRPRIRSSGS